MTVPDVLKTLDGIRSALERNDLESATEILAACRPADQAEMLSELEVQKQAFLLPELEAEHSANILEELPDHKASELVAALPDTLVIPIVNEMRPDEAADLLGGMEQGRAGKLLSSISDSDQIRPLMWYPDGSAGGLMTSDFMVLRPEMSADQAIEALRRWHPDTEVIYYLFVIDRDQRLSGVVSLRELVTAAPETQIGDIMQNDVVFVRAETDQEEVARLMTRYNLLALPVVDGSQTLLGVVTFDDVLDVIERETTEDIQRLGGTEPLERSYLETPPLTIVRKRIGWLLLLFLTATLTGSVIRFFENELQAMVALGVFIPLLIGTGGNAGSQTTATIIRSLATGDAEPGQAFRVWWHEARIGALLGLGMAVAAYLRAITWEPSPTLAVVVAVSVACLVIWATGVGAVLPLLAARLKIDPTVVSGPVMSTLVDATGLVIYFAIAGTILGI
jgi:magnesium transporter